MRHVSWNLPAPEPEPRKVSLEQKPATQLTRDDLLQQFSDTFASRDQPIEGETYKIVLEENATPQQVHRPRPVPYELEPKLRAEPDTLISEDIIEEVRHPTAWVHPIVCAPKGQDRIRLCIDFR